MAIEKPRKIKVEKVSPEEIASLRAAQEALFCFLRGESPVTLKMGDTSVDYIGRSRASGGCVIRGASISFASDWCAHAYEDRNVDHERYEIARAIHKIQVAAASVKRAA
jgi:hypothetical protein